MHGLGIKEDAQIATIAAGVADCGREVAREEIESAVRNSRPADRGKRGEWKRPRWPCRNVELIQNITQTGPGLAGFKTLLNVKQAEDHPATEEIIDALFPDNPLLCAGPRNSQALTRFREQWRGFLQNQQFIVPSPMTSVKGITSAGKQSMRSNSNTGPRRYLVIEFDQGTPDQQASLLLHLGEFAPLTMVVHSGNKSFHGWYHCGNQNESVIDRLFGYAVSLGADPATWSRCQFVRMPDGRRDNGTFAGLRQRVLYYNPKTLEVA